jgi:hypothetical protein
MLKHDAVNASTICAAFEALHRRIELMSADTPRIIALRDASRLVGSMPTRSLASTHLVQSSISRTTCSTVVMRARVL